MTDKEPDEELRQRWWIRMRRAFGIPDLVKDDHARTAVVRTITDSTYIHSLVDRDLRPIVELTVSVILDLAATGELDHFVVDSEQAKSLRDGPVDRVYDSIVGRVRDLENCPPFNNRDAWTGLSEMVGRLIDTVASSVRTFPFEMALGGYFSTAGGDPIPDGGQPADSPPPPAP